MKHLKIASLLFVTILLFASCKKNKTEVFGIKDFIHTNCKSSNSKSLETETIRLKTVNSNELEITHKNVILSCCPNGEIKTKASFDNNKIILNEYNTDNTCNCLCPYDLEYIIGPLDYSKYTVNMIQEDYSFTINFRNNTDTTIFINHNK